MLPSYYVMSISGGKDSTALGLEWLDRRKVDPEQYPLDEAIYCDTGMEFPAMKKHIDKLEQIFLNAGVKFTRLKSNMSFEYLMFEHLPNRKRPELKWPGYSWPGPRVRWCTSLLKIGQINGHLKTLEKSYRIIQLTGLAADEQERLKRENNIDHLHPLADWGWTEADCLKYCYDRGFDWGGLYDIFHRVSCWCCPLQSLEDLRKLRKYFPNLWAKLMEMESRTWRKFRAEYSVDQLEIRFGLEEERAAQGLSTSGRNKEFREALRVRLDGAALKSDQPPKNAGQFD